MVAHMSKIRELKRRLVEVLGEPDWRERLSAFDAEPPKELVGPLLSLLLHREELVRWRAVRAFGRTMERLAGESIEEARVVMRRLMWHMNEESGNIGWGIAETMGEVMARDERLAKEYHTILLSYVQEGGGPLCHGNFLDHPPLRWGVLWGLARLAESRPELLAKAVDDLCVVLDPSKSMEGREYTYEGLECHDATARGLAARALGFICDERGRPCLERVRGDEAVLRVYLDDEMVETTVGALAEEALGRLSAS